MESGFITYKAVAPDLKATLWQLRHFVGLDSAQPRTSIFQALKDM